MRLVFSFLFLFSLTLVLAQVPLFDEDPRASHGAENPPIHVNVIGEGTPTLLLPGFATPGEVFDATIDSLDGNRSYHVFTYAGFGGTSPIDTPWYPKVREALFAYVVNNDLQQIDLVGHSMGGNLATELAARFPERVNKLVILDALTCMRELIMPGVPESAITYNNPQTMGMYNMDAEALGGMMAGMASGMTSDPDKANQLTEWMKAVDRKTFTFGYVDLLRLDLRPLLPKIAAETTILAAPSFGEHMVRTNMEKQYENLNKVEIKIAPKGRHFIMWDAEEWYLEQLRLALTSISN